MSNYQRLIEAEQHLVMAAAAAEALDFATVMSRTRLATGIVLPMADDAVANDILIRALTIEVDVLRNRNEREAARVVSAGVLAHAESMIPGSSAAALALLCECTCEEVFGDAEKAARGFVELEVALRGVTSFDPCPFQVQAFDHMLSCAKRLGDWGLVLYALKYGVKLALELADDFPDTYASFAQWWGFAESNLGPNLDRACQVLESALAMRARNPRRDATRQLVEAELAMACGNTDLGRALFLSACGGLLRAGLERHHVSVTAMLRRRRILA